MLHKNLATVSQMSRAPVNEQNSGNPVIKSSTVKRRRPDENMLETLRSYAEAGKYKRVPVSRELYADAFTPVEVMRTLRAASRHCYLLESAEDKQRWGRYSFPRICAYNGDHLYGWSCDHYGGRRGRREKTGGSLIRIIRAKYSVRYLKITKAR